MWPRFPSGLVSCSCFWRSWDSFSSEDGLESAVRRIGFWGGSPYSCARTEEPVPEVAYMRLESGAEGWLGWPRCSCGLREMGLEGWV